MSDTDATADDLRLAEVMEGYDRQVEAGLDPDPEACLAGHPELAGALAECLEGLAAIAELRGNLVSAQEPAFASRILGDFELLRELGRGGMGIVYEARQVSLDRKVALKLLLGGAKSAPAVRQRFRQEAEAAARLRHPGIVQIYEVGEVESEPYFSMEYVAGPSLTERLAQGPLPIREAAEIVRQTAEAVEHAHRMGILHRDLKPSNVLIADFGLRIADSPGALSSHQSAIRNPQSAIKITDFGLAKKLDSDAGLTLSGQIMGTPSYMPPEQAAGKTGLIGPRSDVYSLGAVLYELLTGRPPFLGASAADTLQQVQQQEPVPPGKLNYRIPYELSVICAKCLQKEPEQRYASAQALADDLQAFLDGRPIQARPDSFLGRLYRAFRQEPYPEVILRRRSVGLFKAWTSLVVCVLGTVLAHFGLIFPWAYILLAVGGVILVCWQSPKPNDTLVERQVARVWQAFFLACLVTAAIDILLHLIAGQPPGSLAPIIAVLGGVANFVMGDLLSGWFYVGAIACFVTALAMVFLGSYGLLLLGVVFFVTLLVPTLRYRR